MTRDTPQLPAAPTVGGLIEFFEQRFNEANLHYGHGTANARDEAAALIFHVLSLSHDLSDAYDLPVADEKMQQVDQLARKRIETRAPLPYLLGEAWFAGIPFFVDQRVLIPRSPVAELIAAGFAPWIDPARVTAILEIGTGSGCIAAACALHFPAAQVTATDISADALAVAETNIARHNLADRVTLLKADLMDGIAGSFDIIVTNPPYVPEAERAELPREYAHEPALGLFSGADGLDSARRILQDAPNLLSEHGILVLEVGAQWQLLEAAFPTLPFTWLEFEHGGIGVAVLSRRDLR
jgi:ribosomal protein L3 glutamine methyltransferase